MGFVSSIVGVIFIVLVIMTAISEPKLSFDYYKSMVSSGGELFIKIKTFFGGSSNGETKNTPSG